MSGPTLAEHIWLETPYPMTEELAEKAATAALAWIEGRLADGDVRGAVVDVIYERTGRHMPQEAWQPMADAALAAVRGVLGEGSSTEGGRK